MQLYDFFAVLQQLSPTSLRSSEHQKDHYDIVLDITRLIVDLLYVLNEKIMQLRIIDQTALEH